MTRVLMEGSEAIAEAMVVAGCRFFAGYPMTPFTEVLEHMARKLPAHGGVCMNAESELEAVGMAWGAAATGTPAATGSVGQGLSLMQESLSEITLARIPLVVLNMARGQSDYCQATRGGGHGDYRHLGAGPHGRPRGGASWCSWPSTGRRSGATRCWSSATTTWPTCTSRSTSGRSTSARCRPGLGPGRFLGRDGPGQAAVAAGRRKQRDDVGYDLGGLLPSGGPRKRRPWRGVSPLVETGFLDGRRGGGRGLRHARQVRPLRRRQAAGRRARRSATSGPITLCPVPDRRGGGRLGRARAVAVYENNRARWSTTSGWPCWGGRPVHFIGGLSLDKSGFGIAPDLDVVSSGPASKRSDSTSAREGATHDAITDHRQPTGTARASRPALVDDFTPALIDVGAHHLCPGCGEPVAMRSILEAVAELGPDPTGHRRLRHRLLHRLLQQPRLRGAPGAARTGAVAGHGRQAGQAGHGRLHHPRRWRHGQRGAAGGHPRRRPGERTSPASCSTTGSSGRPVAI